LGDIENFVRRIGRPNSQFTEAESAALIMVRFVPSMDIYRE